MGEDRYFLLAMFEAPVLIIVRDYDPSFPGVFRQIWADVQVTASDDAIASERLVMLLRAAGYTVEALEYRVVQNSTHDIALGQLPAPSAGKAPIVSHGKLLGRHCASFCSRPQQP